MSQKPAAGGRRRGAAVSSKAELRAPDRKTVAAPAREISGTSHASRDRRLRFAELLLSVSQKLSGMNSLDEVLTGLVEVTTTELNAERGTLFLNDPETNELYSRVAKYGF